MSQAKVTHYELLPTQYDFLFGFDKEKLKGEKMEQISIEQKMLMTLLGAELAKNGKDLSDLSQLLIDIESTNDVGQIFKIITKYFPKQVK